MEWQRGFRSVITTVPNGLPVRSGGKLYIDLKDLVDDQIRAVARKLDVSLKQAEDAFWAATSYKDMIAVTVVGKWRITREDVIFNDDQSIVIKVAEIKSQLISTRNAETNAIFHAGG